MSLADSVAELVAVLTTAGLEARVVTGDDPAVPPCVIVEAPSLDSGRRTAGGSGLLEARCDLVAVPVDGDPFTYADTVLEALDAAGILVDSATPSGYYGSSESSSPLPAYRVTVRWPHTITHTGGTA